MAHGFDRTSLIVRLDADYFPFESDYLQAPAKHEKPILRVVMHEYLHFWQLISSGFLANVALGEVRALRGAEPDVALRRSFIEPHADLGFSAHQLSEALCRFWDSHILNPVSLLAPYRLADPQLDERLRTLDERGLLERKRPDGQTEYSGRAFDIWMLHEDAYANPYRLSLERLGSALSVVLFPLVGFFALQTQHPVEVFANAVRRLEPDVPLEPGFSIHDAWRAVIQRVADVCNDESFKLTGAFVTPGPMVINRSTLSEEPVWAHYADLVSLLAEIWGVDKLELYLAIPGDPIARSKLVSSLRPPATLFRDGRWTSENGVLKAIRLTPSAPESLLGAEELADQAETLYGEQMEFRLTELESRYLAGAPAG